MALDLNAPITPARRDLSKALSKGLSKVLPRPDPPPAPDTGIPTALQIRRYAGDALMAISDDVALWGLVLKDIWTDVIRQEEGS